MDNEESIYKQHRLLSVPLVWLWTMKNLYINSTDSYQYLVWLWTMKNLYKRVDSQQTADEQADLGLFWPNCGATLNYGSSI